jgi:hypothetical protein
MTTERAAVREAARRQSAKDSAARERAWGGNSDVRAYAKWGTAEDDKGKARQRSLRWMELGWEGATTAAREKARKEDVLEMLRALVKDFRRGVQPRQLKELQDEEAERLERLRAEQRSSRGSGTMRAMGYLARSEVLRVL